MWLSPISLEFLCISVEISVPETSSYPSPKLYSKGIVPSPGLPPLRNSLIVYQLDGLRNQGLELPKIHWIEG